MFSAIGAQAVTLTGSPSRAIAVTAAMTAAAPPMSDFIASIAAGGLSDRPPESNVMPLPTSARCLRRGRRRVGELAPAAAAVRRALPDAEDAAVAALRAAPSRRAPRPSTPGRLGRGRPPRSRTSAGGRSEGGVLTRSRARCTASATACARATAALTALSRREPADQRRTTRRPGLAALGAVARGSGGRRSAPSSAPSATAASVVGVGAGQRERRPCACRPARAAAAPAARRSASWSYVGASCGRSPASPRPTATTTGAVAAADGDSLVTSSGLPGAAERRDAWPRARPSNAASTVLGAGGAARGRRRPWRRRRRARRP